MSNYSARDHKLFNCDEEHEFEYVAGLYEEKQEVKDFLKEKCESGEINNTSHDDVYALIKKELKLNKQ